MNRKCRRELELELSELEAALPGDETPFMGLLAYLPPEADIPPDGSAPEYDYLLTSEGECLPPDTDVAAVFPYDLHPEVEAETPDREDRR